MAKEKKKKVKSSRRVKANRSWGGFLVISAMLLVIFAGGAFQFYNIERQRKALSVQNEELSANGAENREALAEVSYFENNKNEIDIAWSSIRNSLPGPQRIEDLSPFPELGLPQIVNNYNVTGSQPGFSMAGGTAEFQRIAEAVSGLEERYPLVQFTKLSLRLPAGIAPMREEATYLEMENELYMPRQ